MARRNGKEISRKQFTEFVRNVIKKSCGSRDPKEIRNLLQINHNILTSVVEVEESLDIIRRENDERQQSRMNKKSLKLGEIGYIEFLKSRGIDIT